MARSAPRDNNFVPASLFEIENAPGTVMPGQIDQVTGRILVDASGTVIPFGRDTFFSTNNQTTFTPSNTVITDVFMSVNGSIQTPSTDYSIVGGNYVLNSGIPAGCAVVLAYFHN